MQILLKKIFSALNLRDENLLLRETRPGPLSFTVSNLHNFVKHIQVIESSSKHRAQCSEFLTLRCHEKKLDRLVKDSAFIDCILVIATIFALRSSGVVNFLIHD